MIKLYEVPRKTVINFEGRKIYFSHVDGMYSLCYEEDGSVFHLSAVAEVSILPKENYEEILEILKELGGQG